MFKKLLLIAALGLGLGALTGPTERVSAQNTTCSDRPGTDVSNACANTRFTRGAITTNCIVFTDITKGCVPASGGGTLTFLRADGTFSVVAAGGGSAIVGMILPWSGATVPDTYLLAYGQAVSRVTYIDLMSVLTFRPSISCTSGSPTITVSTDISDRMPIGAKVEAIACFIAGTTVASKGAGTLTLSNNAGATTSTTATIFPWGNGDGSTTFNVPNLMGRVMVGRDNMSGSAAGVVTAAFYGVNPDALGAVGGSQSSTLVTGNLPAYTPSGTVSGSVSITDLGHNHTAVGSGSTSVQPQFGGVDVISAGGQNTSTNTTGITASLSGATLAGDAQGGTSAAFSRIQPSVTVDYIIKALPDSAVGDTITVGVTNVAGGAPTNILYNNAGKVGEYTLATANQYNCATAGSIVQPSVVYQAETVTTYGTTTVFDLCTFKNTSVTLTGDITTMTLTNVVAGKAGMITYIQDGAGGHTSVFDPILKFTGGVPPTLTATAGAVDILTYACRSATFCGASLLTDVR